MTKKKKKVTPMQKLKDKIGSLEGLNAALAEQLEANRRKLRNEENEKNFFKDHYDKLHHEHTNLLEDFHILTMRFLNEPKTMSFSMPINAKEECEEGRPHEGDKKI